MLSLNAIKLDDLEVVPAWGTPTRRSCVGCRTDRRAVHAVVVQLAGRLVCQECVRTRWGAAADEMIQELARRYLAARQAEVLAALTAAGDRLLAECGGATDIDASELGSLADA